MLTLTAPAGAWRYPAYVTDGDGKAGIRREGRLMVDGLSPGWSFVPGRIVVMCARNRCWLGTTLVASPGGERAP